MANDYEVKVRPEKADAVRELRDRLERAGTVLLTEYRGLTVGELAALRTELAKADVEYKVAKNTLTRIAATELGIELPTELLEGPTAVAFCYGDPVRAAKALSGFARDHPALVVKGGLLDRRPMDADGAKALATVDPYEVSIGKIAGLLQAPLAQVAGLLQTPIQQIAYVLKTRGEQAA